MRKFSKFRSNFILGFAMLALAGLPALAGEASPKHVVELFTSQGCSSCPPSNDLITQWSKQDDVLALTYSVEYWDYLGWKDTFADRSFSDRQRAYAAALGHGRVYTPQIVLNGQVDKARFSSQQMQAHEVPQSGPQITVNTDSVSLSPMTDFQTSATLRLVHYMPGTQNVAVRRGENGGRTLPLTNVVTDIRDLGNYTGAKAEYDFGDIDGGGAYAILLQRDDFGPVIAAQTFTARQAN